MTRTSPTPLATDGIPAGKDRGTVASMPSPEPRQRTHGVDHQTSTSMLRNEIVRAIERAGSSALARLTRAQREAQCPARCHEAQSLVDAACWRLFGELSRVMTGSGCGAGALFRQDPSPIPEPAWLDEADLSEAVGIVERAGEQWRGTAKGSSPVDAIASVHQARLGLTPVIDRGCGMLTLEPARDTRRRSLGVYYTPTAIVEHLLDTALEPVLDRACAQPDPAGALLSLRVCDPSCGSGRFLVAAGRRIAERLARARQPDLEPTESELRRASREVVASCLIGVDLDPFAVELCRWAMLLESGDPEDGSLIERLREQIRVGDALAGAPHEDASLRTFRAAQAWCSEFVSDEHLAGLFHWGVEFAEIFASRGGFDAVIGNPPFLNQLRTCTATDRARAAMLQARFAGQTGSYTDASAAFLLLASALAGPGGRVCMIQPQSLLAARDAKPVRDAVLDRGSLCSLWISDRQPFEGITTPVCAPTIRVGAGTTSPSRTTLHRTAGDTFEPLEPIDLQRALLASASTWSRLMVRDGTPQVLCAAPRRCIGDEAHATADFRDQYYGLDGCLVEDHDLTDQQRADNSAFPPLITAGLIDLAYCRWADSPTRIHKRRWLAPRLDRARLERQTSLGPWLASRMVPKILMATQTRLIEVIVDEQGHWVPSVPVITIIPRDPARLWHVAAALASPLASVRAHHACAGAALASGALKLRARQVLELDCPEPSVRWDRAAGFFQAANTQAANTQATREEPGSQRTATRRSALERCAGLMLEASGVTGEEHAELLGWWLAQLD